MWAVLFAALTNFGSWILPRLLAVTGVVVLSETVYQPLLSFLQNKITTSLSGTGTEAAAFLQYVGVQQAVTIIFAAITLKLGIKASKAAFAKKATTDA